MGANPSIFLVPEVGIEPTLPQGKGDFESEPVEKTTNCKPLISGLISRDVSTLDKKGQFHLFLSFL